MRVGGADGMRLTRAAFAVIIKFSEQIDLFRRVWDAIEGAGMSIDDSIRGADRLSKIVEQIQDDDCRDPFGIICTQWE